MVQRHVLDHLADVGHDLQRLRHRRVVRQEPAVPPMNARFSAVEMLTLAQPRPVRSRNWASVRPLPPCSATGMPVSATSRDTRSASSAGSDVYMPCAGVPGSAVGCRFVRCLPVHLRTSALKVVPQGRAQHTGCSAAWLARLLWEQEAAGSNPAIPTRFTEFAFGSLSEPRRSILDALCRPACAVPAHVGFHLCIGQISSSPIAKAYRTIPSFLLSASSRLSFCAGRFVLVRGLGCGISMLPDISACPSRRACAGVEASAPRVTL